MGFLTSKKVVSVRLTKYGKIEYLKRGSSIITTFRLLDTEINYNNDLDTSKFILADCGDLGFKTINDDFKYSSIRFDMVSNVKLIDIESYKPVTKEIKTQIRDKSDIIDNIIVINRQDLKNDTTILFDSLNLEKNNKYVNTALANINNDKQIILTINNNAYGDIIDGKTVKIKIQLKDKSFNIYGTYRETVFSSNYDKYRGCIDNNDIVYLFSDEVSPPQNKLTWGTKYQDGELFKNGKPQFRLSNPKEKSVGIVDLRRGIIIINEPAIIEIINKDTEINVSFDTYSSFIYQHIICIKEMNEFKYSTNRTFKPNQTPITTSIGLFDDKDKLIALGRLKTPVFLDKNQRFVFLLDLTI